MEFDMEGRWGDFPDPIVTANSQRAKNPAERNVP